MNSPTASAPPRHAIIREMGLRDGLQSIATVLPTARKLEWIRAAYDAGQREIEVGSFVPAHLLPQLADTAELLAYAKTLPGSVYAIDRRIDDRTQPTSGNAAAATTNETGAHR